MADTDTYEKIAATYAAELREDADRLEGVWRDLDRLGPNPQTWAQAMELADVAVASMREKAQRLAELPTVASLWADLEED